MTLRPSYKWLKQEKKAKHKAEIDARALDEIKAKQKVNQEGAAKKKAEREVAAKTTAASFSFS